jgi:SAM-dependent methyltransferase
MRKPDAGTPIGRPGAAAHWREGDHFLAQCGAPSTYAVVEGRWAMFSAAIDGWRQRHGPSLGRVVRVLDAGCGDGINLQALSRMLKSRRFAFELVGMDYNPLRLERARGLAVANSLVHASLANIPFNDESFDIVLCNHVIEHVPKPGFAVAQIAKVLRRDGVAIIGVPNEGCTLARLRNHVLQPSILRTTDHVNFFTRTSLTRVLETAGLCVETIHTEGFFLPHLRLSGWAARTSAGRALLDAARRAAPSQAAGLIAIANRESTKGSEPCVD